MGRVSKRGAGRNRMAARSDVTRWKVGIYARLSSDQNIKKNESIEMQIEIARKFVEEYNQKNAAEQMEIAGCYTDQGKTGSNFEREGFRRMQEDIGLGKITCIIVKDFSRFGRNYLEAGNYIEKIFPFLGVRFIAVADGFDTGREGNEKKQMASEIKNLVNDMYAKDFSKKAKLHLKQRREEGAYVGGPPPYGYKVGKKGKKRILVPDNSVAFIVLLIYKCFLETESCAAVVGFLNHRKINPPAVYKKTKQVYFNGNGEYKAWNQRAVERILKSRTYTGTLVQGKTAITARDERNRIHKSEEEWVITREAHEALIPESLFQKATKIWMREK